MLTVIARSAYSIVELQINLFWVPRRGSSIVAEQIEQ